MAADNRKPWDDIVSLLLVLYQMLTGQTVDLHTPKEVVHLDRIDTLKRQKRFANCILILDQLSRLFDHDQKPFDIAEFIVWTTPVMEPTCPGARGSIPLLLIAANTSVRTRFRLDDEMYKIRGSLPEPMYHLYRFQRHGHRESVPALEEKIRHCEGGVVHIRGEGTGVPPAPDNDGRVVAIAECDIADIFCKAKGLVRCVVLSACYSRQLAITIALTVNAVIWISAEIAEPSPERFAAVFYATLAQNASVKSAFDAGRAAIIDAIGAAITARGKSPSGTSTAADRDLVELHHRNEEDPATLCLFPHSG